jgi:phage-related protein
MSDTEIASIYLTLGLDTSEWLEELNKATDSINKQFVEINSEFTKQVSSTLSETVTRASKQFINLNNEFTKQMSNMGSNLSNVSNDIVKETEKTNDIISKQMTVMSKNATKNASGFIRTIRKKLVAAFGTVATGAFIKSCIEVGSNVTEVQNVVDTAFKDLSWQADQWASNAMTNFGLSELSAKKYMGVFGQMSNAMGITGKAALDMAENVTGLTGDVASFYNLGTDEAYTKLKSIWTGETETLKDLGVIMTQTNLDQYALNNGFGKTTAKMTEQEKVMLRYQYVTSALSNATGDFVKTQDSWANQTRILTLRFQQLKASLGKGFIALFTPILRGFNSLLAGLQKLADGFASFVQMLTGADISSSMGSISADIAGIGDDAGGAADNVSGIGDAAKKTAKDIEKSLAGFDQINKLTEPTDDSSSSGSGTDSTSGIGSVDLVPNVSGSTANVSSAISDMADKVKKALEPLKAISFDNLVSSLDNLKRAVQPLTEKLFSGLEWAYYNVLVPLASWYIEDLIPTYINTLADAFELLNTVLDVFNPVFESAWDNFFKPIAEWTGGIVVDAINSIGDAFLLVAGYLKEHETDVKDWTDLYITPFFKTITDFIMELYDLIKNVIGFVIDLLGPSFDEIVAIISGAISAIIKIVTGVLDILKGVIEFLNGIFTGDIDKCMQGIKDIIKGCLEAIWGIIKVIVSLIVNLVKGTVDIVINLLKDIFTVIGNILSSIKSVFDKVLMAIFNAVISVIDGIKDALWNIVDFVGDTFSSAWSNVWNGIINAFDNIFGGIVDIAKGPINMVIGLINGMLDGLESGINWIVRRVNALSFDVPDWVPVIGGDHFGFDLPEVGFGSIPYLAEGGYVKPNTPQLAMIGDNKHQGEVVAPEDKLIDMAQKAAAMASSAELLAEAISILKQILKILETLDLDIQLDGKSLKKYIVDKINEHTKQTGKCEIIT